MTTTANYTAAADVFDSWRDDVVTGKVPTLYPVSSGVLSRLEIGPGLVTLIGGPPASGKSAFTMQCVIDALRMTPTLRALVCNVEMPAAVLLDRQLARLSGVDLTTIRYRQLTAKHADRIDQAMNTLETLADRLCFVRPPFDLSNVAASADAFVVNLICLDYIQRIAPPGKHDNRRNSVDATMDYLRQFADAGVAVIVVSAVGRSKDKRGRNSYSGSDLTLASFRESSELEFGADDAFILTPDGDPEDRFVTLRHLKARYGEARDFLLVFDRPRQRFIAEPIPVGRANAKTVKPRSALASLWNQTEPAVDEESDGGG